MRNQNLGFEKEQVVVIPFSWDGHVQQRYQTLKAELLNKPRILNVTASGDVPGRIWTTLTFRAEGMAENETGGITALIVDPDFQKTYSIEMAAGRDFSKEIATDLTHAVIINEKAVSEIGWPSPAEAVGKKFLLQNMKDSYVIGVVKDFNFKTLHDPIEPLAMAIWPDWFGYVSVRISTQDIAQTLDNIQNVWGEVIPNRPFNSFFLDEDFNLKYRAEEQFREIFMYFSSLGIFIACLGLFGLTSFSAEQRFKEIGIRKVLGASVAQLLILLTRDITKLLIIANVLAWPIAWYAMNEWLQSFAYRMSIGPTIFLNTALAAFIIAFFTMSFQTVKAALTNPVEAIRNE